MKEKGYIEIEENESLNENSEILKAIKNNTAKIDNIQDELDLFRNQVLVYPLRRKIKRKCKRMIAKCYHKFSSVCHRILEFLKKLHIVKFVILIFMMLLHPIRAIKLLTKIRNWSIKNGCFAMDMLYLKYEEINLEHKNPIVSIVIPVYNQIDFTYKCLLSIEKYTKDVPYEVIIGDDVSCDGTMYLGNYVNHLKISKNKINTGFLKNCNNAARLAEGKYVLFLNNDTIVTEGWLSALVNLIENDKSIGMVGSKLVYPDGRLQEAGGIIWSNGFGCNYGKFDDPNKPQYNYVRDVDYISGAAIMLSKELWDNIGGFDERYVPAYCEDSDLAFEVRKAGYRVVYQPKSVVIHFEGISNGTDVNSQNGLKRYQIENNRKLKIKWAKELKFHPKITMPLEDIRVRDRNFGKGVILVVDHYVPEFDKDAGSRTTFQYLKMFVNQGYKVKFIGDNFYNKEPYTSILQQMGIEVLYGIDYNKNIYKWIELNKENIDVVYLNRPHISIKYIDFIKQKTDIKIIYYGHDLHFLREMREYELTGKEECKLESEKWQRTEFELMRKSDYVYYPSYVEVEEIKKINPDQDVKAINAYMFDNVDAEKKYNFSKRKGIMFVGGFAHTPNVDGVKWFVEEIYPLIVKKKNIPLFIVGSNPPDEIKNLANDKITVTGFVSDEELENLYSSCRMVVAPLRYGAGIKGKIIEAMSKGIPIVTTSIGVEGIPKTDEIISVNDKTQDFASAVLKLYDDEKRLEEISIQMRKYIKQYFSPSAAWEIVKNDFEKRSDFNIIVPDSIGNFYDEKVLSGIINIVNPCSVKVINPCEGEWLNHLNDLPTNIVETKLKNKNFAGAVKAVKKLIILGYDLIDGTKGLDESLNRLKAANSVANNGGKCFIFCNFKKSVDDEIIDYICNLNPNVKFYLSDLTSYKNFQMLTCRAAEVIPCLSYFSDNKYTDSSHSIIKDIVSEKNKGNKIVGLNFSEFSFKNGTNKKDDVKKQISSIIETIIESLNAKVYFVVFDCNFNACGDDYLKITTEVLKNKKNIEYFVIDSNINSGDLSNVLLSMDMVLSNNIGVITKAIQYNVLPLIMNYSSEENEKIYNMISEELKIKEILLNNTDDLRQIILESCEKNIFNKSMLEYKIYIEECKKKLQNEVKGIKKYDNY